MTDRTNDLTRLHDRVQADVHDAREAMCRESADELTVLDHLLCAVESIAAYLQQLHPTILARSAERTEHGASAEEDSRG